MRRCGGAVAVDGFEMRGVCCGLAMPEQAKKRPPLSAIVKTVLWSFVGIRRRAAHDEEAVHLSPVHIVIAGVVGAAILVVLLVTLVRFIVASAG